MSLTLTRRHNVDRFGYLIPTRYRNLPMVGAVATYRPGEGRFGGAVAVEEGTTNLVPSNRLKFEGWFAYSDAQVTLTQNVEFPEIGRNDATRIRTTGGAGSLKYFISIERSIADQAYTGSVYIKNIGPKPVRFAINFGHTVTVNPGEWTRAIISAVGDGITQVQFRFQALNVDDDLDFIVWGPQVERKPFPTSFVDGTRAAGALHYPQLLDKKRGTLSVWINPHVVVNWNQFFSMNLSTGRFLLFFRADGASYWDFGPYSSGPHAPAGSIVAGQWAMHTLTWDADAGVYRYYLNGELVGSRTYVEPDSLPSTLPTVINYGALLDEFLILPYAASEGEIRAWYEADGPIPPHPDALLQWDRQAVRPAQMVKL